MLSQRILVLFVLIGATPPMVLGLVLFVMVKAEVGQTSTIVATELEVSQVRQINERSEAEVQRLASQLDERIRGMQQGLQTLARLLRDQPIDALASRQLLNDFVDANAWISQMAVIDVAGTSIAAVPPAAEWPPLTPRASDAVQGALALTETAAMPDGSVAVFLYRPLRSRAAGAQGHTLVAVVNANDLHLLVREGEQQHRYRLNLRVITQERLLLPAVHDSLRLVPLGEEASLSTRSLEMSGSFRRGTHLVSYAHTTSLDWRIEATVPLDAALLPAERVSAQMQAAFTELLYSVRTYSLTIILAFLLLAAFVARFVARDITNPIDEVVDGITRIANGYLQERVPVHRQDELGFLAGAVNRMAEDLEHSKAELLRIRDRSEHIMKGVMDVLLMVDVQNRITACNPTATEILGYAPSELIRQPLDKVFETTPGNPLIQEKLDSGREVDGLEGVLVTSYGARLPVLVATSALTDHEQQRIGSMIIARDITDQLQVEEDRRRLAAIVQGSSDLIATLSTDGQMLFLNTAGRAMLDISDVQQLLGKSLGDFCSPDDGQRFHRDILPEVLRQGRLEGELLVQSLSHRHRFPAHFNFTLIKDPRSGEPALVSAIGRDITERKRSMTQLRRYAAELEASNRELEEFAFVASHDLREPLRKLHNLSQLLERRYRNELDDQGVQILHFITESATRMLSLIKDLLEYARLGLGTKPFQPVDCNALIQTVLKDLSLTIQEQQASISCGEFPIVHGDDDQLAMLFRNLVSNALKFHGDAPPEIALGAERHDDAWRFFVRDNGIGIDPVYRDKIFIIFQRLQPLERFEGTGIGLAMCKKIVERHDGRIWVESTPDHGATFYFTLPADPKSQGTAA